MNAAIVPESCAPRDLLWIIRAGLKADNETLTNTVLGEETPFLQETLEVFHLLLLQMSRMNEFLHGLNQLFTDPEDKDAQSVNYDTCTR